MKQSHEAICIYTSVMTRLLRDNRGIIEAMKLRTVLSKANSVLSYLQRRRKAKLYQQWVERAGLPSDAVPEEESAGDIIPKIHKEQLRIPILYMLLGAALVILFVGVILIIISSCRCLRCHCFCMP